MKAVSDSQGVSPQAKEKPTLKARVNGPLSAAFTFLTIAAVAPAFVHTLFVVGRWSWQLIG
jgi:hypothetical protein